MIIKRSTYEKEMLKAFQSGRESKLFLDDDEAIKNFANSKNFTLKSLPKPLIFGAAGTGMVRCFIPYEIQDRYK